MEGTVLRTICLASTGKQNGKKKIGAFKGMLSSSESDDKDKWRSRAKKLKSGSSHNNSHFT